MKKAARRSEYSCGRFFLVGTDLEEIVLFRITKRTLSFRDHCVEAARGHTVKAVKKLIERLEELKDYRSPHSHQGTSPGHLLM